MADRITQLQDALNQVNFRSFFNAHNWKRFHIALMKFSLRKEEKCPYQRVKCDLIGQLVKFIIEDYIRAIYQIACAQTPHLP